MSLITMMKRFHEAICANGSGGIEINSFSPTLTNYFFRQLLLSELYILLDGNEEVNPLNMHENFDHLWLKRSNFKLVSKEQIHIWRSRGIGVPEDIIYEDDKKILDFIAAPMEVGVLLIDLNKSLGSKTAANSSIIRLNSLGIIKKRKVNSSTKSAERNTMKTVVLHLTKYSRMYDPSVFQLEFEAEEDMKQLVIDSILAIFQEKSATTLDLGLICNQLHLTRHGSYCIKDYFEDQSVKPEFPFTVTNLGEKYQSFSWNIHLKPPMKISIYGEKTVYNMALYEQSLAHLCESKGMGTAEFSACFGLDRKRGTKLMQDFTEIYKIPSIKVQDGKQQVNQAQPNLPFNFGNYGASKQTAIPSGSRSRKKITVTSDEVDIIAPPLHGTIQRDQRSVLILELLQKYGHVVPVRDLLRYMREEERLQSGTNRLDFRVLTRLLDEMKVLHNLAIEDICILEGSGENAVLSTMSCVISLDHDCHVGSSNSEREIDAARVAALTQYRLTYVPETRALPKEVMIVQENEDSSSLKRPVDQRGNDKRRSKRVKFADEGISLILASSSEWAVLLREIFSQIKTSKQRNFFDEAVLKKEPKDVLIYMTAYIPPGFLLSVKKIHEYLHDIYSKENNGYIFTISSLLYSMPFRLCCSLFSFPNNILDMIFIYINSNNSSTIINNEKWQILVECILSNDNVINCIEKLGDDVFYDVLLIWQSMLYKCIACLFTISFLFIQRSISDTENFYQKCRDIVILGENENVRLLEDEHFRLDFELFPSAFFIIWFWDLLLIPFLSSQPKSDDEVFSMYLPIGLFGRLDDLRSHFESDWIISGKWSKVLLEKRQSELPLFTTMNQTTSSEAATTTINIDIGPESSVLLTERRGPTAEILIVEDLEPLDDDTALFEKLLRTILSRNKVGGFPALLASNFTGNIGCTQLLQKLFFRSDMSSIRFPNGWRTKFTPLAKSRRIQSFWDLILAVVERRRELISPASSEFFNLWSDEKSLPYNESYTPLESAILFILLSIYANSSTTESRKQDIQILEKCPVDTILRVQRELWHMKYVYIIQVDGAEELELSPHFLRHLSDSLTTVIGNIDNTASVSNTDLPTESFLLSYKLLDATATVDIRCESSSFGSQVQHTNNVDDNKEARADIGIGGHVRKLTDKLSVSYSHSSSVLTGNFIGSTQDISHISVESDITAISSTTDESIKTAVVDFVVSKGAWGVSLDDVLALSEFEAVSNEIVQSACDHTVKDGRILIILDEINGTWLVGSEFATIYTNKCIRQPWLKLDGSLNTTFYNCLRARVLSILSYKPGATVDVIYRDIDLLTKTQVVALLETLRSTGCVRSELSNTSIETSLFDDDLHAYETTDQQNISTGYFFWVVSF